MTSHSETIVQIPEGRHTFSVFWDTGRYTSSAVRVSGDYLSCLLEGRGAQEAVRGQGRLGDPVDEGLALRALPQFSDKGDVADQKVNVGLRREGANEELRRLPVEDGIQNRLGDLLSRGRRVAGSPLRQGHVQQDLAVNFGGEELRKELRSEGDPYSNGFH